MSRAVEKRDETALAPLPKEEVPASMAAIALLDEGYWQRMRKAIVWQTELYVKKRLCLLSCCRPHSWSIDLVGRERQS